MTDEVQKIREEIERLFNHVKDSNFESDSGAFYYFKDLLDFIDSLQEEPANEDLEEAAKNHAVERYRATRDMVLAEKCKWSFKAGAEWQKEQDKETIELAEDHAMLAGMEKMREQMMKDAVDAFVYRGGIRLKE